MSNPFAYTKPVVPELTQEQWNSIISCCRDGFSFFSYPVDTLSGPGEIRTHSFSLSGVFGGISSQDARVLCDDIADHLRKIATSLGEKPPVLAYVCSSDVGLPTGIPELRGALAERLGWPSLLISSTRRLLRKRVSGIGPIMRLFGDNEPCILLAETSTTGEAIAQATGNVTVSGPRKIAAAVIYDPEEGAEKSLATIRVPLYPIFNRTSLEERRDDLGREIFICSRGYRVSDLSGVAALAAA